MVGASLFWGVGFTSYTAFMGHLGTDAAAANSVAAVIRDLFTCVCNGLCTAAGIMVGNCGRCRYSDYYYNNQPLKHHSKKTKKMHRGMHNIPQNTPSTNNQIEGFIIEVEQPN